MLLLMTHGTWMANETSHRFITENPMQRPASYKNGLPYEKKQNTSMFSTTPPILSQRHH